MADGLVRTGDSHLTVYVGVHVEIFPTVGHAGVVRPCHVMDCTTERRGWKIRNTRTEAEGGSEDTRERDPDEEGTSSRHQARGARRG